MLFLARWIKIVKKGISKEVNDRTTVFSHSDKIIKGVA